MIIDWHNYGYTLMALALGKDHIFVNIAKRYATLFTAFSVYVISELIFMSVIFSCTFCKS